MSQTDWNKLHGDAFKVPDAWLPAGQVLSGPTWSRRCRARREMVVLDNLVGGDRSNIERFRPEFVEGSILDEETLRRGGAAATSFISQHRLCPHSVERPMEYHEVHATGTLRCWKPRETRKFSASFIRPAPAPTEIRKSYPNVRRCPPIRAARTRVRSSPAKRI